MVAFSEKMCIIEIGGYWKAVVKKRMGRMDYERVLNTITEMGYVLLRNGAEIYRVEESMQRLCSAYGLAGGEVFAISSCIIFSFQDGQGQNYSRIKRVLVRGTDLDKVEKLNALCREVCAKTPPIGEVAARLREIEGGKRYGFAWQVGAFALVSAGFTLLFGGEWRDAVLAALCGAALKPLLRLMEGWRANFFFANLMGSALVAALALTSFRLGVPVHTDKVIIGTLMNLVPGVALTNFMRDLMAGDFIAGMLKLTEALLIATAIALGTGVSVWLLRMPG